jgi:hypothetical protein
MKTFRELCDGLPSRALQAMVDGLEEQDRAEGRGVGMDTFWSVGKDATCFACAATCAIQSLAGKTLCPDAIGASPGAEGSNTAPGLPEFWGHRVSDISAFEDAIDIARMGAISDLLRYMKVARPLGLPDPTFWLQDCNWKEQIPEVKTFIEELKARGL